MKRASDGLAIVAFALLTKATNDKERDELRSLARSLPVRLRQNGLNAVMLSLEAGNGSANVLVASSLRSQLKLSNGFPVAEGVDYAQKTLRAESLLRLLKLAAEADHNHRAIAEDSRNEAVSGDNDAGE
jgi:hypothetical protein